MAKTNFQSVDEYIATFSAEDQAALTKIRKAIQKAAPNAEEVISYQIPAYKEIGYVIYFSGFKEHYSLAFPPPFTVFTAFAKELAGYQQSKSVVQLPKSEPLPLELIGRMVKFRLDEQKAAPQKAKPANKAAAKEKATGKPAAKAKAATKGNDSAKPAANAKTVTKGKAPAAKATAPAKKAGAK
ncbi:iron chaperone [Chitinophaga deserti]|uniref:iron chaperone n=1 Tax=Chitinophaga deserti TaxID=2164099 RepID=UPI000D6C5FA3|nr:DUF1801 domain-containing protein [Chitinophaga deserti]